MKHKIQACISDSIDTFSDILNNKSIQEHIAQVVHISVKAFKNDKKMLFCGNGGSASDAQHIAAELSGRFYINRSPLYAEALHVNSSYLTAVSNDFGYDETYARMLEAAGRKGDVLVGISTSGNSSNVVKALERAKKIGLTTIGFTGSSSGEMDKFCDIMIKIPSDNTPRIQEAHILVGHIICQLIEEAIFTDE